MLPWLLCAALTAAVLILCLRLLLLHTLMLCPLGSVSERNWNSSRFMPPT